MTNRYYTIIERIKDNFCDMEGDMIDTLRENNSKYDLLKTELMELDERHPFIRAVLEDKDEMTLTAEQHGILVEYLIIKDKLGYLERMNAYFCGHTDCFSYLREIGAITK